MSGPWEKYQKPESDSGPWAQYQKESPKQPEERGSPFLDRMKRMGMAGAQGLMRGGPVGAVSGVMGEGMNQFGQAMDKAAYGAGGAVTDVVTNMGASPEVAAGAGFATNVATQAVPTVLGAAGGKLLASPAMKAGGRKLMQSALKPTLADLKTGKAAKAVDTLLDKGINPTRGGVEKLRGMVDDLGDEIQAAIANSPATVNKGEVGKRLLETYNNFKNQVNPQNDLAAIKRAWLAFRNHPLLQGKTEIPVSLAQKMKQGTYKQLQMKAHHGSPYGQLGAADIEAQKALARGLKEEIASAVPKVSGMNKTESELINALNVAERRALMDANKNPMGLALLANHPATWVAFMADKSALFKSLVARMLHSGSGAIPTAVGGGVGGLYGSTQGQAPNEPRGALR